MFSGAVSLEVDTPPDESPTEQLRFFGSDFLHDLQRRGRGVFQGVQTYLQHLRTFWFSVPDFLKVRQQYSFAGTGGSPEDNKMTCRLLTLTAKVENFPAVILHDFNFLFSPHENRWIPPVPRLGELFYQGQVGTGWIFRDSGHTEALPSVPI